MFPGISIPAEGLPSFSAGETWAVKVPGNPAPIAVSPLRIGTSCILLLSRLVLFLSWQRLTQLFSGWDYYYE